MEKENAPQLSLQRESINSENDFETSGPEIPSLSLSPPPSISSKRLHCQFFLFSLSILCSVSSFSGLMDLQSSINISDALGNKSLMLMSISTVLCCLFITPLMVRALGAKITLLFSQACFVVYTLANFYPVHWTLLPGGCFLGIAIGLLYTPALMYCTYYGRRLASMKSTSAKNQINKFVGYFWGIYQMNEIFGNTISTVILSVGKSMTENKSSNNDSNSKENTVNSTTKDLNLFETTHTLPMHNVTTFSSEQEMFDSTVTYILPNTLPYYNSNTTMAPELHHARNFALCGANDCYDQSEYEMHMDNYVPISSTALYIMIGIYTFLAVIAIPVMAIIPELPRRQKKNELKNMTSEKKREVEVSRYFRILMKYLRNISRQFIDRWQLLLTPLTVYHGLYVSFVSSEITRGYVSCTMGVEQVGLAMLAGGITNVIVSFLFGHLAGHRICRNFLLAGAIALDLSLYIFCLFWNPAENTVYYAYIICILFGLTDGVWSPFLDSKYAKYFLKNEEVAYSVHNVWEWGGFALTYGWTMAICIRAKIYIQISMLIIGVIGCVLAELLYKKKSKDDSSKLFTKGNDEKLINNVM